MPELPEVENIKFGLEDRVIDKEIVDITYSNIVKSSHKENKMAIVKQELSFFSENVKGKKIEKLDIIDDDYNKRFEYIGKEEMEIETYRTDIFAKEL